MRAFARTSTLTRKEILYEKYIKKQTIPQARLTIDRGSADRYYQRNYEPHFYPEGTGKGLRVTAEVMHEDELKEYALGYWEEDDKKDYG